MNKKLVILTLVSLVTFFHTIFFDFVWDDVMFISEDVFIKTERNPFFFLKPDYWLRYFKGTKGRYRPLRTMLFWFGYRLWGLRPQFYHMMNVIFHTLCVVFIYLFLRSWVFKDETIPYFTAMFFAIHPVHVESVAWVKNCTDLLCLIFYILSFHFVLKSFYDSKTKVLSAVYYFLAMIFYVISILAKEMGITLPMVIMAYLLVIKKERNIIKNFAKIVGYVIPLLAMFVYKVFVLEPEAPLTVEVSYVVKTFGEYLQILLFPFNLCADRKFTTVETFYDPVFLFGIFGIIVLGCALYHVKDLRFPLLWLMITILPVLNIIYLEGRPVAEQRLYIPSLGFCMVLSYIFHKLWQQEKLVRTLFILLVCSYWVIAIDRSFDWRNSLVFWEKTVNQTYSLRALSNYAEECIKVGDYDLALKAASSAISINPAAMSPWINLGIVWHKKGDLTKAKECFKQAIVLEPEKADGYINLGALFLEEKKLDLAFRVLEKAISLEPENVIAHFNLARVYTEYGMLDKALYHYKLALTFNPELEPARVNYSILASKVRSERN